MADSDFVLFYAWQSDRLPRDHRSFIEACAEKALKQLAQAAPLQSAVRLDKDTKGVPGMPDIANTILAKIDACSAFLADITFVGEAVRHEGDAKKLPNPNVLLELGYAVNRLGWERVLCVMNTHYGAEDDLPFDLRHRRWPLKYCLAPGATDQERADIKQRLVKDLAVSITTIATLPPPTAKVTVTERLSALEASVADLATAIANAKLAPAAAPTSTVEKDPERGAVELLDDLVQRARTGALEGLKPVQGMLAIALVPVAPAAAKIDFHRNEIQIRKKLWPLYAVGWDHRYHGTTFSTFSVIDGTVDAVSEISEDGNIGAMGHSVIDIHRKYFGDLGIPPEVHVIPSVAYEQSIIEGVQKYLQLLVSLNVPGPWILALRLFDLKQSVLYVKPGYSHGRQFVGDEIKPAPVRISADVDVDAPQAIARALRPVFDHIWRDHNFPRSLNYSANGDWVGQ